MNNIDIKTLIEIRKNVFKLTLEKDILPEDSIYIFFSSEVKNALIPIRQKYPPKIKYNIRKKVLEKILTKELTPDLENAKRVVYYSFDPLFNVDYCFDIEMDNNYITLYISKNYNIIRRFKNYKLEYDERYELSQISYNSIEKISDIPELSSIYLEKVSINSNKIEEEEIIKAIKKEQSKYEDVNIDDLKNKIIDGDVEALYTLGILYKNGDKIEKNKKKAFECFKKAAEMGNEDAKFMLGECYCEGIGVDENKDLAYNIFKELSEKGHLASKCCYAHCLMSGYGCIKNLKKCFEICNSFENTSFARGYIFHAMCYEIGIGTNKDLKKAAKIYEEASKLGREDGPTGAGRCYLNLKEYNSAFYWFSIGYKIKYRASFYYMGVCYENGYGTEKNLQKAIKLYKEGADIGYGDAIKKYEELKNLIS